MTPEQLEQRANELIELFGGFVECALVHCELMNDTALFIDHLQVARGAFTVKDSYHEYYKQLKQYLERKLKS